MQQLKRNTIALSLAHATFAQCILLGSGAAAAQEVASTTTTTDTAKPAAEQMDRIVVTATRRNTFVQETPLAVTAFNQDTLQNNQVKDLASLATMVPSLVVEQHGDSGGVHVYMRGVGSANHTELGDAQIIHATLDGRIDGGPHAVAIKLHGEARHALAQGSAIGFAPEEGHAFLFDTAGRVVATHRPRTEAT